MSGRYINNPEELLMDIKDVATQFREEILEVVNEIMLTDYNSLESKVQEKVVEDKNLTFEQLCEYVSVTRPTIYKWKKKGLKSYKVEGKVLFKLSEVQEFLKSHQNK
jgi:excisionase family DNA binding protein